MLIGRLGKDVEVHYTKTGEPVAKFSLATSEKYKDKEETEWTNCVLFRKNADNAVAFLKKGDLVYIEGKKKTGSYVAQDGSKKYTTDCIVSVFRKLTRSDSSNQTQEQNREDDIPF